MVVYSNNDNIESEENISKIKFNFYHGRKIPFAKLKQRLTKKRIIKKSTHQYSASVVGMTVGPIR